MKHILKKLALLALPVAAWFCFFVAFEPNNYFGLKQSGHSTAPIARVRAFAADPGRSIILGDSRLAHFDPALVEQVSGRPWQNLAFGGASLKETNHLLEYALDTDPQLEEVIFGLSFYTLSSSYNTDRMSSLQDTLKNPLAYCLNLEYNVNALTGFTDWLAGREDSPETGDWVYPQDYTGEDGTVYPVHTLLAQYPAALMGRCQDYQLNWEEARQLEKLAQRCQEEGVTLTVVLPPMADCVLEEVCIPNGIDRQMEEFLPTLSQWADRYGFALLDYEWADRPDLEDDTQFYDGFHLDQRYGLPQWTAQLFAQVG